MREPTWKVATIKWWHKPVPLMQRNASGGFDQVGYLWNQRAYLVNNLAHGWIGFIEDQTAENINVWCCDHCGAALWGNRRRQIIDAIAKEPKP